ncbi:methylase [Fructilactobacillus cliffordii]|uniref:methylase n=1 Tax=Fructilactobacillus cliffordii TaxID=2940299 RepID=UPI002093AA08|nr:methylase [Fructilactobacillus cliffordii]USS86309.1 methylase [Fructilactobacillus cliffordii]
MDNEEINLFDDHLFENKEEKFKLNPVTEDGFLIKSKNRVQHHGEVFTPKWMVKKMLSEPSIQNKLHDLHATFFEPSAGEGAFLKEILHQKLNYVDQVSNKRNWNINALWALMSIYAVELLNDNLFKARQSMIDIFVNHYQSFLQRKLSINTDIYKSVNFIINVNIVQGNTLTYKNDENKLIEFSEWIPVGNLVERSIFTYKSLFENDDVKSNNKQLSLFDELKNYNDQENNLMLITKVYKGGCMNG